jgi:hypothetical protein
LAQKGRSTKGKIHQLIEKKEETSYQLKEKCQSGDFSRQCKTVSFFFERVKHCFEMKKMLKDRSEFMASTIDLNNSRADTMFQ